MIDFEELHVFDNKLSKYVPREMYEKAYRAWKRAAKMWRKWAHTVHDDYEVVKSMYEFERDKAFDLETIADRRLELLRKVEWVEVGTVGGVVILCPLCRSLKRHGHASNCELAEALVSDQMEEELGDD
jgi:hypothetical protein